MRCTPTLQMTLVVATVACVSSPAERARHARNAEIDAHTVALTSAIEDTEDARIQQVARRHEVTKYRLAASRMPDQTAAKLWIKAHEQRSTYEVEAIARLDTLGVRIDAARQKLAVLGDQAPGTLRSELSAVQREYRKLDLVVHNLPATPAADWHTTIDALSERMSELSARVTLLTTEIEDQKV
jgi:hypothetical protein